MSKAFWIKRFSVVASGAFVMLSLVYLVRGRALNHALSEAFVWAIVSSAIFTAVNYYRVKQCNQSCEMCHSAPEHQ